MAAKKKPYLKTIIFGAASIFLYVALLTKQDIICGNCSIGGAYAFMPIGIAFLFSFIHGSFTGHFWTVMGVEAAKKIKEG